MNLFYAGLSGLNYLFMLPRPHGLGYEILAFQAMAQAGGLYRRQYGKNHGLKGQYLIAQAVRPG